MTTAEALESDLAWRESELASLKRYVMLSPDGSVAQRGLLRALWAMLYAHYEGFTKHCWDCLLDEIQSASVLNSSLCEPFALLALEDTFRKLKGDSSPIGIWDFATAELPSALGRTATFPEDCRLSADSNLWPNVFERESGRVGISCSQLDLNRARIKLLVKRRNEIAHGKSLIVKDLAEYQEYENAAFCIMHELALAVLHKVEKKTYLSDGT
jgi:hypothetical protein